MNRASIYFLDDNDKQTNTYAFDEQLPPLPLPDLHDTLQRYYESVQPFGNAEELAKTRVIIDEFEKGIGAQLHAQLKERASKMKNWLEEWWDKYAYLMLRIPLNPYTVMAMPLKLEPLGIEETPANLLKNLSRVLYHTLEFWELLHKAKAKPLSSNGGQIKYSSALYKRFFSTTRVPGVEFDNLEKHFKTVKEGKTPTHVLISGKGRLFTFDCLHSDGSILSPQELIVLLQRLRSILDYEQTGDCVPVLTHDDRTTWANNRRRLIEISPANQATLQIVESSNIVIAFDENEPQDYEQVSQYVINGDYHSKWGDRSSTMVAYKNGKFGCIGEHSSYDGTVSVSYALFILLSMHEEPEPDWCMAEETKVVGLNELKFDLDDTLRNEIQRVMVECDQRRTDVIVTYTEFKEYGKDYIKHNNLNPDSFFQVIMQLAYARMHNEIAPTYETALMRHYYNGRTETLRSCTSQVHKFLQIAMDPQSNDSDIAKSFRAAVVHHREMMNEARKGHGIDRHLFGLWCIAYENGNDIPEFYTDPLYLKSGGGGNYILSTSTLGYTVNIGFAAPMLLDGYGVFYTITSDVLYIQTLAFRNSTKTSARKFNEILKKTFQDFKSILEDQRTSKL